MPETTDLTVTYPTIIHKRQAGAAVHRVAEQSEFRQAVGHIFGTGQPRGGTLGKFLDLLGGTYVAEIIGGWWTEPDTHTWHVAVDCKRMSMFFHSLDMALLAAVEWRNNGANLNAGGHQFAARALGVPEEGKP